MIKRLGRRSVVSTKFAVRKAGDGLSKSIAANGGTDVDLFGRYFILMEVDAKKVHFEATDPEHPADLVATFDLHAGTVTFVDKELAGPLLAEQADRNEAAAIAAEEARGVLRFPSAGTEHVGGDEPENPDGE